jgi:putative NADH-flavin reductase
VKLLVLGATGATGRLIVTGALERGHEVTALVRSREKASSLDGATLLVGDARDEATLRRAVKGVDAVISSLGTSVSPFREVTLLSQATRALVAAMNVEHISRLICITGVGAGDSVGHGGFVFNNLFFPLLLRKVYQDKDRQEAIVKESGLDWVLVRPVILNDKPARGSVRALTDLSSFNGGTVSRADVANFVLDQVRDETWSRRAPLITW